MLYSLFQLSLKQVRKTSNIYVSFSIQLVSQIVMLSISFVKKERKTKVALIDKASSPLDSILSRCLIFSISLPDDVSFDSNLLDSQVLIIIL